jgi:peptidyl-prolyl cis-trans isomerase SurA
MFRQRLTLLLTGLLAAVIAPSAAITPIDEIIAIVDEDVVMRSELESQMLRVISQMRQQGAQLPPRSVFEKQVLERLILQKIQLQRAEQTGIRIDEETLNGTIARIAADNGLTIAQFREILQQDGYEFRSFREDIRNELIITRLRQREVENRIIVTDREIDHQLANLQQQGATDMEFRIKHILIASPAGTPEDERSQARERALEVVEALRSGADFAATAARYSDGQQAADGGDLGWRKAAEVPTIFNAAVIHMDKGDVSDIIESGSGFHVIQLADKRSSEMVVVEQTHPQHILIKPSELTTLQDARTRLEQLKFRIESGDSFEELARSHSDDRGSAVEGGDLGWVSPGDLVPEFEEVMNDLAPGEISEPFQSQFGVHIVRVLERRDYDGTEEVRRAKAREIIRRRKVEEKYETWLRELRDEAYVEHRVTE